MARLKKLLLSRRYFYNSIFLFPCRAISHDIAWCGCYCTGPGATRYPSKPRCALIRIDAFERRVTWYFVWEETRRCSGMDNKHFITLVSMHIAIIALGCIFTCLRLVKIPMYTYVSISVKSSDCIHQDKL